MTKNVKKILFYMSCLIKGDVRQPSPTASPCHLPSASCSSLPRREALMEELFGSPSSSPAQPAFSSPSATRDPRLSPLELEPALPAGQSRPLQQTQGEYDKKGRI